MTRTDGTSVLFLIFVGLLPSYASNSSYSSYTTIADYSAANVTWVNFLNTSKSADCSLVCTVNCYCTLVPIANTVTASCAALPGYVNFKVTAGNILCKRVDYCANSCHGTEVKTPIPGGCQCTCPPCYSANSSSNSICVLNNTCCGEGGSLTVLPNGNAVCSCKAGYQSLDINSTCIDIDECQTPSNNTCALTATCTNTPGSYVCSCNAGYDDISPASSPGRNCTPSMFFSDPASVPDVTCINCDDCAWGRVNQMCVKFLANWTSYNGVFITENGAAMFGKASLYFTSTLINGIPAMALYSTDIDSSSSGSVCISFHRKLSNVTADAAVISRVNALAQLYLDASFQADSVFIYTLKNARPYGYSYDNYSINAQMITATGSSKSYTFFIFPRNGINWPTTMDVIIGSQTTTLAKFSAGDSSNNLVFRMDQTSNVDKSVPGFWALLTDKLGPGMMFPGTTCCLASQGTVPVTVPNTCPYNRWYAANDLLFVLDWSITNVNVLCYADRFWSSQTVFNPALNQNVTVNMKQRCCYYTWDGRLAQQVPYGGMAMTDQAGDADFFAACSASKVSQYRPISKTTNYNAVKLAGWGWASGDVHYGTFDWRFYDFHGLAYSTKEQITVRSVVGVQPNFTLQCEAPQYMYYQVSVTKACALRCNGGPVLQLAGRNPFGYYQKYEVLQNGNLVGSGSALFNQATYSTFTNMAVITNPWNPSITVICPGTPIVTFFLNGYGLSLAVALSASWRGKVEGFLGNFDGDAANDIDDRVKTGLYRTTPMYKSVIDAVMKNWLVQPGEELLTNIAISRKKRDTDSVGPSYSSAADLDVSGESPLNGGVLSRAKRDVITPTDCWLCSDFSSPNVSDWTCNQTGFDLMNNTCSGEPNYYSECMLDLAATCDVESVAKDVNMLQNTTNAAAQAAYQPPQISGPDTIHVTYGQTFTTTLSVTGNYTTVWVEPLPGYNATADMPVLNGLQLVWSVSVLQPVPFEVLVSDSQNNVASWSPTIYYCGCTNNGSCSFAYLSNPDVTATSSLYTAQCVCVQGYSGDACELNICQGLTSPCDPLVTCTPNGPVATCGACPSNTLTVGGRCVSDSAAGNQSPCYNAGCQSGCIPYYPNMTYTCTCPAGWQLDASLKNCTDVNECANADSSVCSGLGNCTNTPGSYTCTCNSGYTASPTGGCVDLNECAYDACQALETNRACTNMYGSYTCACSRGYQPVNGSSESTCEAINFCASNPCTGGSCNPIPGSFYCSCPLGQSLVNDTVCEVDTINLCQPGYTSCPLEYCSMDGPFLLCNYTAALAAASPPPPPTTTTTTTPTTTTSSPTTRTTTPALPPAPAPAQAPAPAPQQAKLKLETTTSRAVVARAQRLVVFLFAFLVVSKLVAEVC